MRLAEAGRSTIFSLEKRLKTSRIFFVHCLHRAHVFEKGNVQYRFYIFNNFSDTVKVEGEFAIVSGLKWQAELSNNTSFLYKQQTTKIVTEVSSSYFLVNH